MTNAAINAIRQIAETMNATINAPQSMTAREMELLPGKQRRNRTNTVAFTEAGTYRWNDTTQRWER